MIGLDTNVLVRILAADDPIQTPHATRFLQDRCSPEEPGFVNCVVIIELTWVLQNAYRHGRADIVLALEGLLANASLEIESREQVERAVRTYKTSNCDLVDALIGEINRARGCEATATFDRKAAKVEGFIRVP
jgi:predicted nucleic-acid-binding protein